MKHFITLLVLLAVLPGVPGAAPAVAEDEAKKPVAPRNLLDEALTAADLRRTDLLLPRDLIEPDPFRRAVVDRLMEHPLEMPGYVRALGDAMLAQESLLGMFQLALAQERIDLGDANRAFVIGGRVRYPEAPLEALIRKVLVATRTALGPDAAAMTKLRSESAEFAEQVLSLYGGDQDEEAETDVIWMRELRGFLDRVAAVDRALVARHAETVLGHAELLAGALAAIPANLLEKEKTRTVQVEGLTVRIGGPGDDVHEGEVDIVIDVGGDDVYGDRTGGRLSIVIDLAGDDVHRTSDELGVASSLLGASVLIDLAGDDVYRAGDHSLACGVLGLGILDDRAGNDIYVCGEVGQGAGVLGWGLLVDRAGNDVYVGRKFVQAFAGIDGFGMLLDREGNDVYSAGGKTPDPREKGVTQSLSQGFAYGLRPFASGGIALLLDAAGNDAYEGDYFAQGSSYWWALGALVDRGGNDRYAARRYSAGAGIHLTLGVLVDESGNDVYSMGLGVGLGCGHDYATGILLDAGGNDSYHGAWLCLGAGNANGVGILCDVAGRDAYSMTRSSLGWGTWDKKRETGSIGLLLDGGGVDAYPAPGVQDESWSHGSYGGGVDGTGGDPFPKVDLAAWLKALPEGRPAESGHFTKRLPNATVGTNTSGTGVESLIAEKALRTLGSFRAGMEAKKKTAREWLAGEAQANPGRVVPYLESPNILVLIEAEKALVAAKGKAVPALSAAALVEDRSLLVSRAIAVLAKIDGPEGRAGLEVVLGNALRSEDVRIRRAAAAAAAKVEDLDPKMALGLMQALESPDLRTRAAAARSCGIKKLAEAKERLTELREDPHHTVRFAARAALKALGGE